MAIDIQAKTHLRQFHLNQCVWVSRLTTGEISPPPDHTRLGTWHGTIAMRPGASGVLMLPIDATNEATLAGVDASLMRLRTHPLNDVLVWRMTPDTEVDLEMLARGFRPGFSPDWMTRDLTFPIASPKHEIRLATARDAATLAESDVPYVVPNQLHTTRELTVDVTSPDVRWLIAHERGQIVGQAIVNLTGNHAGLFNVGVSGRHRRKGIGTSLTLAAMQIAREDGAITMNLNSTPMGLRVYERLGFVRFGQGQTWSAVGQSARTAIAPHLAEATLAIGRGDTGARSTRLEEVPDWLPCELTSQQLAARFGQQDMIRHLIGLGRTPDVVAMWQAGMGDEAISACQDPAARELPTGPFDARPLHHAVEAGAGTLVLALIRAGADLTARDDEYDATPLDWAHATNKPTIARILRQAGAR